MGEQTTLEKLNRQLLQVSGDPFYQQRLGQTAVQINSIADFEQLPLVEQGAFAVDAYAETTPRGSFYNEEIVRINLTPSAQGLRPVYLTRNDVQNVAKINAETLRDAGVTEQDIAITTLSYSLFPAGMMIHEGFEALGAKMIPVGPGDSERTRALIEQWGVTVLYGNPSFALKLAEDGIENIRVLFAGGEPFSAIDGYKDGLRQKMGSDTVLIESYGLAECTPFARECRFETGMHIVEEWLYVEVIDPITGDVLPHGQVGELVVTHLEKEAMPLIRYRTGDLAMLERSPCGCGRSLTIKGGIRGRVGSMKKVKGVKVYPEQIRALLDDYPPTAKRAFELHISASQKSYLGLRLDGPVLTEEQQTTFVQQFKKALVIVPSEILYGDITDPKTHWKEMD